VLQRVVACCNHCDGCCRSECTAAPIAAYQKLKALSDPSLTEALIASSGSAATATAGMAAHDGINFGEVSARTAGFWGFFQFYWDEYARLMNEAKILMVPLCHPRTLPARDGARAALLCRSLSHQFGPVSAPACAVSAPACAGSAPACAGSAHSPLSSGPSQQSWAAGARDAREADQELPPAALFLARPRTLLPDT
jgi:hypothetical protein